MFFYYEADAANAPGVLSGTWTLMKNFGLDESFTSTVIESADVSDDGNVMVLGEPTYNSNRGRLGVYRRTGSTWNFQYITASAAASNNFLGSSVALTSDGNTIVSATRGSTCYLVINKWDGASWTETKVASSYGTTSSGFGGGYKLDGISVSDDGNTIVVSGYADDISGTNTGRIYVFKYNNSAWSEEVILASDVTANDYFGNSLDMSADGNRIVVGTGNTSNNKIYVLDWNGSSWEETILSSSAAVSYFGKMVSISAAGDIVVTTSLNVIDGVYGRISVFKKNGAAWTETIVNAPGNSQINGGITISGDGLNIFVAETQSSQAAIDDIDGESLSFSYAGKIHQYKFDASTSQWQLVENNNVSPFTTINARVGAYLKTNYSGSSLIAASDEGSANTPETRASFLLELDTNNEPDSPLAATASFGEYVDIGASPSNYIVSVSPNGLWLAIPSTYYNGSTTYYPRVYLYKRSSTTSPWTFHADLYTTSGLGDASQSNAKINNFVWSPSSNRFAFYIPEANGTYGGIGIYITNDNSNWIRSAYSIGGSGDNRGKRMVWLNNNYLIASEDNSTSADSILLYTYNSNSPATHTNKTLGACGSNGTHLFNQSGSTIEIYNSNMTLIHTITGFTGTLKQVNKVGTRTTVYSSDGTYFYHDGTTYTTWTSGQIFEMPTGTTTLKLVNSQDLYAVVEFYIYYKILYKFENSAWTPKFLYLSDKTETQISGDEIFVFNTWRAGSVKIL